MSRLSALAVLGLAACAIPEDGFPGALAEANCSYGETCNRAAFEQQFVDKDACVTQLTGEAEVLAGSAKANNCEYRPENATECIAAWSRITDNCDPDTVLSECDAVWVCP